MTKKLFNPEHINATQDDLAGNGKIGRYIFFPGSDNRAKSIAEHFYNSKVKKSPRGHNLYTGTLKNGKKNIDVAAISSGMGTPSLDIILNELLKLGAKRFLRVGTSGLLQPDYMHAGDFVIATGAVRDDGASNCYVPPEFPAIAAKDVTEAAINAANTLHFEKRIHTGIVHSKASLFAREFGEGPLAEHNEEYMQVLRKAGVIASEMEASMLFILSALADYQAVLNHGYKNSYRVKAGCICAVLGEGSDFGTKTQLAKLTDNLIALALQTIIELANYELI